MGSKDIKKDSLDGAILNLQFLRAAAATLVVADHLIARLVKRGLYSIEIDKVAWALGEVGVATFFAISGFIMVHTTIRSFGTRESASSFIRRRFVRIAPLYYLTTLGWIAFKLTVDPTYSMPSLIDLGRSLAFIPYRNSDGLMQPIYGLGWTLEYEMYFYLLFALGMCFRAYIGLPAVVTALAAQVGFGAFFVGDVDLHSWWGIIVAYFTHPIMLYFIIGMAIALLFQVWKGPAFIPIPDALLCLVGSLVILGAALNHAVSRYLAVAITVALLALLRSNTRSLWFSRFSRLSGNASYSIYLTHSFVLGPLALIFFKIGIGGTLALFAYVLVACAICLVVACVVWRWMEMPIARAVRGSKRVAADSAKVVA